MSGLQLTRTDFNTPKGALLGIISAAYNLGAVFALPLVPYINDRFGRRWSIFLGSWIMVVASLIQALSVSGMLNLQIHS
jgi:MFS family permease